MVFESSELARRPSGEEVVRFSHGYHSRTAKDLQRDHLLFGKASNTLREAKRHWFQIMPGLRRTVMAADPHQIDR